MNNKRLQPVLIATVAAVLALALLAGQSLAAEKKIRWKGQSCFGVASPLGLRYHIRHGIVCGVLMPYVMEYSLEQGLDKYAEVARLLQLDTQGMSSREAAQQAVAGVRCMLDRIGVPSHLGGLGVKRGDLGEIITQALPSANLRNNPRPLGAEDLRVVLERAL